MITTLPAHGLGNAAELPVSMMFAVVGASWALTITFVVIAWAWREPRFAEDPVTPPPRRPWLAIVGAAMTGLFLVWLFAGPSEDENRGVAALYVVIWVGQVPLALAFGHVWRDLSPWRWLQSIVGRVAGRPHGWFTYPAALGHWPAALGLLAFAWLELASPEPSSATTVQLWVLGYIVVTMLGGSVFGPTWFDRADPFDVYGSLVARLSPFVRDGRWTLHNPLRSLAATPQVPGLVAVVAVLLGSTVFDSFSAMPRWAGTHHSGFATSLTLVAFCVAAGSAFAMAAMATGGVASRRRLPAIYAHTLIPIAVGYVLAHYLSAFVGQSPEIVGLGDAEEWVPAHAGLLSVVKVSLVVVGHLLAVLAAHDTALRVLPAKHRLTGQLAMLLLMVTYTFAGLYLLLST